MGNPATPSELDELWVWEAFRSLPVEGRRIHERMVDHFRQSGFLVAGGDTLEIGGGDAYLWDVGGEALLNDVSARGQLHVTDSDPELVAKCRALPRFARTDVVVEGADVTQLSYMGGRFARVIVTHVLHWCGTPERVRGAIDEIARVLSSEGRAIVVTVDELVQMAEVYALMQAAKAALLTRGVAVAEEIPRGSPRVLPFCAGNAAGFLTERFADVRRIDCDYAHLVEPNHLGAPREEFLVRYLRTLPFVKEAVAHGRLPEMFFTEVRARVRATTEPEGVFRMSRRDVLYDCRRPTPRAG